MNTIATPGGAAALPEHATGPETADRAELIAHIDREIDLIHATQQRDGWTRQAIVAAMGALAWIVVAEIESGYPNWTQVGLAVLAGSALIDAVQTVAWALRPRSSAAEPRFLWLPNLLADRASLATSAFRDLVLVATVWCIQVHIAAPACRVVALLYFAGSGLINALACVSMHKVLPHVPFIPIRTTWTAKAMKVLGAAGLGVVVAYAAGAAIAWGDAHPAARTLRIGGALSVLLYLITRLNSADRDVFVAEVLSEIRRRVVLHGMPLRSAAEALDVVVLGYRVPHVLRRHVLRVTTRVSEAESLVSRLLKQLRNRQPAAPGGDRSASPSGAPRLASVTDEVDRLDNLIHSINARANQLIAVTAAICRACPDAEHEANTLTQTALDAAERVRQARVEIVRELGGPARTAS